MKRMLKVFLSAILIVALLAGNGAGMVFAEEQPGHVHEPGEVCTSDEHDHTEIPPNENGEPPATTEDPPTDAPEEPATGTTEEPAEEYNLSDINNNEDTEKKQEIHDAYFSETHLFEWEPLGDSTDFTWFLKSDSLYIQNVATKSTPKLIAMNVTDAFYTKEVITFIVNNNEIHSIQVDGLNNQLLYKSTYKVDEVIGNTELIFFVEDGIIKRIHIATGIVDELCARGGALYYRPYNADSLIFVYEAEGMEYGGDYLPVTFKYFYYDINTGVTSEQPSLFDNVFGKGSTSSDLSEFEVSINNNLESAQLLSTSGLSTSVACTHHDNCNINGSCGCTSYYHNRKGNAIQCMGFARYIHNLWHGYDYTLVEEVPINAAPTANDFRNMRVGAWVSSAGNPQHSWVVLSKTSTTFTIYEANNPSGTCRINTRTLTFDEAPDIIGYLYYYTDSGADLTNTYIPSQYAVGRHFNSSNYPTCDHSWFWTNNASQHWKQCSICSEIESMANHTPGSPIDNGNGTHYTRCTNTNCLRNLGYISCFNYSYSSYDAIRHRAYCICGASLLLYEHSWSRWVPYNGGHVRSCSTCNYAQTGNCTPTGSYLYKNGEYHYRTCSICGGQVLGLHTLAGYTHDVYGHYRKCTACGISIVSGQHSYQWITSASGHYQKCSVCARTTSQVSHTFGGWSSYSGSQHVRRCSVCSYAQYGSHGSWTYGGWIKVSTASTCRRRTMSCGTCSYSTYEYDYTHNYPLIGKQCKDCNYKKP